MLNEFQKRAVERSLRSKTFFLIHGPPWTGKTTTLVASIEAHIKEGFKVLACADSNVAVDNLLERLAEKGLKVIRIGNPVRVSEKLRKHTLEEIVRKDKRFKEVLDIYKMIDKLKEERDRFRRPEPRFRRGLTDEQIIKHARTGTSVRGLHPKLLKSMAKWIEINSRIKELFERAKKTEQEIIKDILSKAEVVCATNSSAGSELLEGILFDVVFIDEATQATEPSCLIPIVKGNKVIMAGDHKQLPPTVVSLEAKELTYSLFERLIDLCGEDISEMLRVQYRMNEKIMEFPNKMFYGGLLIADASVKDHNLKDLGFDTSKLKGTLKEALLPENVVVFVSVKGKEEQRKGSTSYLNVQEAEAVRDIVYALLEGGLREEHVGVISPYEDQVDLMSDMVPVEVKTVDGFQGKEKEVIVISFVRSNSKGDIGFLKDYRRLNVALTRAKRKLIAIGNPETLSKDNVYKAFLDYVKDSGLFIEL